MFPASAVIAYLPLILLSDVAVLAHTLLCEWTVPTSVFLPEPVSPCLFDLMSFIWNVTSWCSRHPLHLSVRPCILHFDLLAPSLTFFCENWQVLTSFPMLYFCMQRPSKMVFLFAAYVRFLFGVT